MIRSMWSAASGMQAQTTNIDVISNNLANVSTSGFKRSRADFQDLLYETIRPAGAASSADGTQVPSGIQVGHGVRTVAVQKSFQQGDFQRTDNQLDMAIEGDGFFQILMPNGETGYTRAGTFKLDSEGRVVTSDGYLLTPELTVPDQTTSVHIAGDGTVTVKQAGSVESTEIGTIELARFINPAGLSSIGKNLYEVTEASGDAVTGTPGEDGLGPISQGFVELSNVKVVDEMVNMIAAQRAYEVNSKTIRTADEMLQMANNIRR